MPWIQLRLSANEDNAEKYSDWLSACGSQAVTFIDAQDTPIYEPLPGDEVIYKVFTQIKSKCATS